MRRLVIAAIAALAVAALAAGTLVIGRTAPADDEHAAQAAHRTFLANLAKADRKAVGATLDRRFTWTDADGKTLSRREALKAFPALVAANQRDGDVQTHFYGRVLSVRGSYDNTHFLRIFVKRRHGWKAFVLLETPIAAGTGPASVEHPAARCPMRRARRWRMTSSPPGSGPRCWNGSRTRRSGRISSPTSS
jgi:hypothetical protein